MTRLPDTYFDRMYASSEDPWQLATRWYDERKYAITMSALPHRRYRHAFEPGCSIGTLTQLLAQRCDQVTATDVADEALRTADTRLTAAGCRDRVRLLHFSLDEPWPQENFDLVVLSEIGYYLHGDALERTLARECARLARGTTVVAAHWRHRVAEYPLNGEDVHQIISATSGLTLIGGYRDEDVIIEVFDNSDARSVAARENVPGTSVQQCSRIEGPVL